MGLGFAFLLIVGLLVLAAVLSAVGGVIMLLFSIRQFRAYKQSEEMGEPIGAKKTGGIVCAVISALLFIPPLEGIGFLLLMLFDELIRR